MIRVKFCLECVFVDLNLIIKYYFVRKKLLFSDLYCIPQLFSCRQEAQDGQTWTVGCLLGMQEIDSCVRHIFFCGKCFAFLLIQKAQVHLVSYWRNNGH